MFTAPQTGFTTTTAATQLAYKRCGVLPSLTWLPGGLTYSITATYSGDGFLRIIDRHGQHRGATSRPRPSRSARHRPSRSARSIITATVTLTSASGVGTPSASVTVTPSGINSAPSLPLRRSPGQTAPPPVPLHFTTNLAGTVTLPRQAAPKLRSQLHLLHSRRLRRRSLSWAGNAHRRPHHDADQSQAAEPPQ